MASNGSQYQAPDPPSPRRQTRGRELVGIAAVVVVLLLVGVSCGQPRDASTPASLLASPAAASPTVGSEASATPSSTPAPQARGKISIPALFDLNPELAGPMKAGFGVRPNQSVKSGSLTLSLGWAYADSERVIAYYTIQGIPPTPTPQPSDIQQCAVLLSVTPGPSGRASLGPIPGPNVRAGAGGEWAGKTLECYAERDGDFSNIGSFVRLSLSLPDVPLSTVSAEVPVMAARVADPHEQSTVNGQSVTLDRVVVTPAGMRLYFSGPGKGPGQWSSLFRINGWSPTADGREPTSEGPLTGTNQSFYDFYYPDAGRPGPWTMQMMTYDKSGKPITDPSKTATFTFNLPPVDWNPSATPTATPATTAPAVLVAPAIPSGTAPPSVPSPASISEQAIKGSQAFSSFPAARRVINAGMGTFIENPVRVGQAIIDVRWVYADANEIAIFYTVWNREPVPAALDVPMPPEAAARIACPAQLTISASAGTIVSDRSDVAHGADQKVQACVAVAEGSLNQQHRLLVVDFSGNLSYTNKSDPAQAFHLAFNVPLTPGLVATPYQHSSIDGKTITLDRLAVTPTRVSVTLSGPGSGTDVMGEVPDIIVNGWSSWQHSWGVFGPLGNGMLYSLDMSAGSYPKNGVWRIEVISSLSASTPSASSSAVNPAQIATFTVKLPQPNWLHGAAATPAQ